MTRRSRKIEEEDIGGLQKTSRTERSIKPKFAEQREREVNSNPLRPMNDKQKQYINLIIENDLVLATGHPGTSKTYIPTTMACQDFRLGHTNRIVFTRPATSKSKSVGYFKGSNIEKMSQWLAPVMDILRERLGNNVLEHSLANGSITFLPLETIKGFSANDCYIICDEAEDLTPEEAEVLVTRQGKQCKMILCGDLAQSDLKQKSGLLHVKNIAEQYDLNCGVIDFSSFDDIVRSKSCKEWTIALSKHRKETV